MGPQRGALACGGPLPIAISVLLSVFPLAPYLPCCGETLRSSYSFTNPFIFLARHENAEPELWNEPSHLQWVESGADRRQREKRESRFSLQPSTGIFSVARSDTLLGQSGRKYRTPQACAFGLRSSRKPDMLGTVAAPADVRTQHSSTAATR